MLYYHNQVHERDKDTDFCLLLVRHLQATNSPLVKIVLMSATIDSSMFANYFATSEGPAPVVDISGKFFEVTEVYLGSMIRFGVTESVSFHWSVLTSTFHCMLHK